MPGESQTASQVQASLVQVLENFRRCGLTRFERYNAVPDTWMSAIDGVVDRSQELQSPSPPDRDVAEAPQPSNPKSASPASVFPTTVSSGEQEWSLPVLDDNDRAQRFAELKTQVEQCRKCEDIVGFRQQTVFGDGHIRPKVCFMGEAPGADEDRTGVPFVGRAGQLLSKIIAAMKLNRDEVYILNALKCRPPQNRTPVPDEIDNCRHFVESQLEILQPQYIVCLGAVAVRSILESNQSIGRMRGRFHTYRAAKVVVTYHPSYLLRNENAKRLVWDDMKMLMNEMGLPT